MMWTWQVSTAVLAGEEAIEAASRQVAGGARRALLVSDPTVAGNTGHPARVSRALSRCGVALRVVDAPGGPPSTVDVDDLARRARLEGADLIVAVGGGSIIDLTKTAALEARNPAMLEEGWAGPAGVVVTERATRPPIPVLACPTTVGTGSEVSAVACVRDGRGPAGPGQVKKLLVAAGLRPTAAALDPALTATTPRAVVLSGALEVLLRTIGACMAEDRREALTDAMAAALAGQVVAAGDLVALLGAAEPGRVSPEERAARHRLAVAGAHTHTGWVLAGRGRYAHQLWYLAHEVASALGVTKMQATAAVLPAYIRLLGARAGPDSGRPAGRLGEVSRWLGGSGDLGADLRLVLQRWNLPADLASITSGPVAVDDLARRTWSAWGPPSPALQGMQRDDLEALYHDALVGELTPGRADRDLVGAGAPVPDQLHCQPSERR